MRTVAGAEPARSTATDGLVASTDADSLIPAQLVASVSSIRAPAFRLPALAESTLAPVAAEARLTLRASVFVCACPAPTVTVVRVAPPPGATNSTG